MENIGNLWNYLVYENSWIGAVIGLVLFFYYMKLMLHLKKQRAIYEYQNRMKRENEKSEG